MRGNMLTESESHQISEKNIRENLRKIEQSLEEAEDYLTFCIGVSRDCATSGYSDKRVSNSVKDVDECQRAVDYWKLEIEEFTSRCAEYLI